LIDTMGHRVDGASTFRFGGGGRSGFFSVPVSKKLVVPTPTTACKTIHMARKKRTNPPEKNVK